MEYTIYKEEIKYFAKAPESCPFGIEMTGTSYCDSSYYISRTLEASNVYVLEYIIEGEGTIHVNSKEYHPQTGDFYLLQPGKPHEYYSSAEQPWVKLFVNLYGPLCKAVIDTYGLTDTVLVKNCDVRGLFEALLQTANEPELPDDMVFNRCAGKFVEIIARVSSHISDENPLHSEEAIRMRQYVDKNTHRFVSVAELADSISRSLDYTAKLFKAEFDITPYEYQIRQKMDICKRLLSTTSTPIHKIAESLGYIDQQYFSRLFKKRCGMSPRVYRSTHQQDNLK